MASFSIATDEAYTDKQGQRQQRVDWYNVLVFGKAAESCKEYLKKGREVYVEGRLRIREYEAKDNGGKRQRTAIIASRVQFLGARQTEAEATTGVEDDLASMMRRLSGYLDGTPALSWRGHFPAPRALS